MTYRRIEISFDEPSNRIATIGVRQSFGDKGIWPRLE